MIRRSRGPRAAAAMLMLSAGLSCGNNPLPLRSLGTSARPRSTAARAAVPNIPEAQFQALAEKTKRSCLVARATAAVPARLQAHLVTVGELP
jgi:hypothetical protein